MMEERLHTINTIDLLDISELNKQQAMTALESGKVMHMPCYGFLLTQKEQPLLSETLLHPNSKNISYDYQRQHLGGYASGAPVPVLQGFMHRFAEFSKQLIDHILPDYNSMLKWGRTSYRPAEIKGRKTSKRKDDTRLHVDSFSATPVNGLRILRVFSNINPHGEPRVWHIGEPFPKVLQTFAPTIPPYNAIRAKLLKWTKITKTLRSAYDHYMLQLHDRMKLDDHYQAQPNKIQVDFHPNSTWVVFTDQVSHAALRGQYLLEQTFYLPVSAMRNPDLSPLKQWEKEKACTLA